MDLCLTAYILHPTDAFSLIPAPLERDWMQTEAAKFSHRCLPLLMANQAAWWVVTNRRVRAVWNGSDEARGIVIEDDGEKGWAATHFGCGVLTFSLPWLFATSPGWDLLVRGPANVVKDGISPLEGLVETDWSPMTFTMNWKFTRPGPVSFAAGEPVAQIVPMQRGMLAGVVPRLLPMQAAPETLQEGYRNWVAGRAGFLSRLSLGEPDTVREGWQKAYTQGAQRTRAPLAPFTRDRE